MAAQVQVIEVGTQQEMEATISLWVVQGFMLANKTPTSATMIKRKVFSALWAIIGLVICVVPLLVYLIVYATESDKVVEIRLRAGGGSSSGAGVADNLSELERLKDLLDRNVISREEFDQQKRRLL